MISYEQHVYALKAAWVKRFLDQENTGSWKVFFRMYLRQFGGYSLFEGNFSTKYV